MRINQDFHMRFNQAVSEIFDPDLKSDIECGSAARPKGRERRDRQSSLDEALIQLGDTYINLRQCDKAMRSYRQAFHANPGSFMAFSRLILLHPHLFNVDVPGTDGSLDGPGNMERLVQNDTFRQCFIGGTVILSRQTKQLRDQALEELLLAIQNLDSRYFEYHGGLFRDHGQLEVENEPFAWMINQVEAVPEEGLTTISVLMVMSGTEYGSLLSLVRDTAACRVS